MKAFFKRNFSVIIICVAIAVVASSGAIFVNIGLPWFDSLAKPSQWIPNFIIPLFWAVCYIGFAIILSILVKNSLINNKGITLAIINGILNILWCLAFFTLRQTFLGEIVIIINAFFAVLLLVELLKSKKWFVNFLWIYPTWLFIATMLNTAIWILN